MFERIGRWATAHAGWVCAAWLGLAAAVTAVAPSWSSRSQDDDVRFLPASTASVTGFRLLERAFPDDVFASRAVLAIERRDDKLTASDFEIIDAVGRALDQLRADRPELGVTGVVSRGHPFLGRRLVSDDGHCALIVVSLATPYLAIQTRTSVDRIEESARAVFDKHAGEGLALYTTGAAGIGRDLIRASAASLDHTTWATIALVLVVLLAAYRSPVLALIPLATIGVSAWVALEVLALATHIPGVHLVNVSQVFAVVILFGAGTDYCLFLIGRYREELSRGQEPRAALVRSVRAVGGALTASAGTVICGLAMLGFAEFAKIRCAGPIIAVALAIGLAASLTLTPALLRLAGRWAFWPHAPHRSSTRSPWSDRIWRRLSAIVVDRPGWILGGALAILVPLAAAGLRVVPTISPIGDLAATSESVLGLDAVRRHFPPGEIGPITVLLAADQPWDSSDGRAIVDHLSRGFTRLDGVAEVRSLTQPFGEPADANSNRTGVMVRRALDRLATSHFAAECRDQASPRFVTRLEVVLRTDPFAPASRETLAVLERWLSDHLPARARSFGPVEGVCYGVTVHARDLAAVVERDRARVNGLVLVGIFLILVALVRRVGLAVYLLATVLLSYLATLGLTAGFVWLTTGRPFGELEWRVPFFLFTILVAVGEDYNILLISRILKERKRHGVIDGVRLGLERTGGIITACGVVMAGTFATLMLSGLGTLVQIGFALAAGVLLETLIIRPFLAPAFLVLMDRMKEPPEPATLPFPVARGIADRRAA